MTINHNLGKSGDSDVTPLVRAVRSPIQFLASSTEGQPIYQVKNRKASREHKTTASVGKRTEIVSYAASGLGTASAAGAHTSAAA